jgi:DsbC/DsbD-like thiol-disulfide interchange protein
MLRLVRADDGTRPDAEGCTMSGADERLDADFETWHVYDAGGPVLRLVVRYRDDAELPDWRDGPDLFAALDRAAAEGWHAYDREPGAAPGEYAIVYLTRDRPGC